MNKKISLWCSTWNTFLVNIWKATWIANKKKETTQKSKKKNIFSRKRFKMWHLQKQCFTRLLWTPSSIHHLTVLLVLSVLFRLAYYVEKLASYWKLKLVCIFQWLSWRITKIACRVIPQTCLLERQNGKF